MMIWNRDNPHNKITTYKIRWYHKDQKFKDIWKNKWIGSKEYSKNIYDVYLHSLKLNLKRKYR